MDGLIQSTTPTLPSSFQPMGHECAQDDTDAVHGIDNDAGFIEVPVCLTLRQATSDRIDFDSALRFPVAGVPSAWPKERPSGSFRGRIVQCARHW